MLLLTVQTILACFPLLKLEPRDEFLGLKVTTNVSLLKILILTQQEK